MHRRFLMLAGLLGFLGVLLGAFGAHGLKGKLSKEMLETFEVGVRYHLVHAVALLVVASLAGLHPRRSLDVAGWSFVLGILIFSGSLYVLAVSGFTKLGMITPVGGAAFMVGWIALAVAGWNERQR